MDVSTSTEVAAGAAPGDPAAKDLLCPLCDYNLRGLVEPRCPECGFSFTWDELIHAEKTRHPYLFEHYPRRNVWSLVRTVIGGMRPGKFWTVLRPTHAVKRGRMVRYWMILAGLLVLGPMMMIVHQGWESAQDLTLSRARWVAHMKKSSGPKDLERIVLAWGSVENYVDTQVPKVWSRDFAMIVLDRSASALNWGGMGDHRWSRALRGAALLGTYLAWPWMTLATLLIFRWSMRRAKILPVHVMRCAVYACDQFWIGVTVAMGLVMWLPWRWMQDNPLAEVLGYSLFLQMFSAALFGMWCMWRLLVAYRKYLQFPHALATVAASQLIVVLIVVAVLLNV
jgi:hypothetical protein